MLTAPIVAGPEKNPPVFRFNSCTLLPLVNPRSDWMKKNRKTIAGAEPER